MLPSAISNFEALMPSLGLWASSAIDKYHGNQGYILPTPRFYALQHKLADWSMILALKVRNSGYVFVGANFLLEPDGVLLRKVDIMCKAQVVASSTTRRPELIRTNTMREATGELTVSKDKVGPLYLLPLTPRFDGRCPHYVIFRWQVLLHVTSS
jgi:hypothetical protein